MTVYELYKRLEGLMDDMPLSAFWPVVLNMGRNENANSLQVGEPYHVKAAAKRTFLNGKQMIGAYSEDGVYDPETHWGRETVLVLIGKEVPL